MQIGPKNISIYYLRTKIDFLINCIILSLFSYLYYYPPSFPISTLKKLSSHIFKQNHRLNLKCINTETCFVNLTNLYLQFTVCSQFNIVYLSMRKQSTLKLSRVRYYR